MKTGFDIRIHDTAVINHPELVVFGNHISIDIGVYISTAASIGDYVHIAPYVCIIGGAGGFIEMGDFTNIGTGAKVIVIGDDFSKGMLNPIVPVKYRNLIGGVVVMKAFSVIGANSVVMPNVRMAEGSALGANSFLNKDTEPWKIYAGSPAKIIGIRDKKWIIESAKELGYEGI